MFFRNGFWADEGVTAYGAERVWRGEVPYRDFRVFVTPASFYVWAGLYHLFGVSIPTLRLGAAAIAAATVIVIYRLAGRSVGRTDAALLATVYGAVAATKAPFATYYWTATLSACLAGSAFEAGAPLAAGAAAGLVCASHPSLGIFLLAGLGAAALLRPPTAREASRAAAGFALAVAPVVVALATTGALDEAIAQAPTSRDLWVLRTDYGMGALPLPWGLGAHLLVYAAPLGTAAALARWLRRGRDDESGPPALLAAIVWASCLYRPDAGHIYWSVPLAAVTALRWAVRTAAGRTLVRAALFVSAAAVILLDARDAADLSPLRCRRGVLLSTPAAPAREWVAAIEGRVAAGERTFIFPFAAGFYFYCDVRNATPYEALMPHVQHTMDDVAATARALEADPPAYLFDFWLNYVLQAPWAFPAAPMEAFAEHPLAGTIERFYEPEVMLPGPLIIWRRRAEGAVASSSITGRSGGGSTFLASVQGPVIGRRRG